MKSSIILTFFLKLFCDKDEDLVKINTALLLKNNFWEKNEILEDNNKKSLKLVVFNVWNSYHMVSIVKFNEKGCIYNPNDEKFYYLINPDIKKIILSHLKEKKDIFLTFDYIFEHSQSENEFSTNNNASKLHKHYSTYYDFKTLTYTNEKFVFKDDNIFLNKYHIKIIMSKLIEWKSCYINNLDGLLNNQFEDQTSKFTLLYFESLSSCFENFKKFVDFLNWRKNKKIDSNVIKEKSSSENYKSILKISELKRNLNKMFNANYNEVNEEGKQAVYFNGKSRFLFNKLLNKLKVLLSQKIVFLPIGGIYTKQFYFNRIYGQIHRLILNLYDEVRPYFYKFPSSLYDKYVCEFEIFIKHLSSSIISDVWESLDIEKYVANFLGKENLDVEDYTKANNIFSDFHNMILFILAKRNAFVDVFSKAIFVDTTLINKFECDLFWAYEITFKDSVVFGEIKAYNIEGNEINFEKDIDFYEPLQRDKKIIVLIETIRRKKIEKIEVFSIEKLLLKRLIFQEKSKKQKSWWDSLCSKLGYS